MTKKRNQVIRAPERGNYDKESILSALASHQICHIAINTKSGPVCLPMFYFVYQERLYIHGSKASRLINTLLREEQVCVAVTNLDGLVLARSAFHHSMNYRSVVIHGTFKETPTESYLTISKAMVNHLAKDRGEKIRLPNKEELAQTRFVSIGLEEATCKVRSGPPVDDEEDLSLDVWAGVLPMKTVYQEAIPDSYCSPELASLSTKEVLGDDS